MRKTVPFLAFVALAGLMAGGCASAQQKLGRGVSNTVEVLRLGEFRRSEEQAFLWEGPDAVYGTGFVRGIGRTLMRTGLGVYEVVTFPIPPYTPPLSDYYSPDPVFPDNYTPNVVEDSMFATDSNLGFAGGDVVPMAPGSRFRIFDTQ
jgi:putative exosortase-associated protein (TIGR04073 family)